MKKLTKAQLKEEVKELLKETLTADDNIRNYTAMMKSRFRAEDRIAALEKMAGKVAQLQMSIKEIIQAAKQGQDVTNAFNALISNQTDYYNEYTKLRKLLGYPTEATKK